MNDEIREAFSVWIEKEKGWKLKNNEGDDTDNMWEGFQAAYQLQQTKLDKAVSALERLARLGNGSEYGNSDGNVIAQQTLLEIKESK